MAATRRPAMRRDDQRDGKIVNNFRPSFKGGLNLSPPKQGRRTEGLIQDYSEGSSDDDDEVLGYDETDRCCNLNSNEYGFQSISTPNKGGIDSLATETSSPSNRNMYRPIHSKTNKFRCKDEGASELNSLKMTKKIYPNISDLNSEEEQHVPKKNRKRDPTHMIAIVMIFILIIVAIASIIYYVKYVINEGWEPEIEPIQSYELIYKEVKKNLNLLYRESKQSQNFWSQVMSQVKNLFEADPLQPSILLVLIPANSKKTAVCLVHKLQEIISSAFRDQKLVMLDGKSSSLLEAGTVKHQLDESLSELNSQHVAIIHNIEKIPPEAAMILHAYCDNENAPHKRALIILTIGSNLPYDSLSIESASANIDEILEALWRDKIRDVDIPAIISRIANAPVLVKPEPNYVIESLCPYK